MIEGNTRQERPFASLREVAGLLESGELSPVELTETMLARIEALDGRLMSYATVTADRAREAARVAEREIRAGLYRGPLHGIPIAVKDTCYTRGVPTMAGTGVLADFVPEYDATVVARLEDEGVVLLGKLNLTEAAWIGYHPDFEVPVNPWGEELWPGFSSSGSGVATAAGLCYASLGTDAGGSIRFPSEANGVVGLKPTWGRVSLHGVISAPDSLAHVGPMARTVEDAALVLQVIAGHDSRDPNSLDAPVPDLAAALSRGVEGLRIGVDRAYLTEGVDPGCVEAITEMLGVLESLGATVVEIDLPPFTQQLYDDGFAIFAWEMAAAHRETYPSRAGDYGPALRELLALGTSIPEAVYADVDRRRRAYADRLRSALAGVDAAAIPPGGPPTAFPREVAYGSTTDIVGTFETLLGELDRRMGGFFTFPANFAGTPTLTLPCGATEDGLPLSGQFMAAPLMEPILCRIGHAFQQATEWHLRHPEV